MEALYLLVPLSLMLVAFALWIFFGAAESGQFDDLEGPALRILQDDDSSVTPTDSNVIPAVSNVIPAQAGTQLPHRTGFPPARE
jgi:cbb3-type cytochrome oxidase maturation protein